MTDWQPDDLNAARGIINALAPALLAWAIIFTLILILPIWSDH